MKCLLGGEILMTFWKKSLFKKLSKHSFPWFRIPLFLFIFPKQFHLQCTKISILLLLVGGTPFDAIQRYGPMWSRVTRWISSSGPWIVVTAKRILQSYSFLFYILFQAKNPLFQFIFKSSLDYFFPLIIEQVCQKCNPKSAKPLSHFCTQFSFFTLTLPWLG